MESPCVPLRILPHILVWGCICDVELTRFVVEWSRDRSGMLYAAQTSGSVLETPEIALQLHPGTSRQRVPHMRSFYFGIVTRGPDDVAPDVAPDPFVHLC